jgi:LysR family transcriptional regulator, glycine cleavage system transcriptional activator
MFAIAHLRSLQAVELALRTGSLKAAADVLAITPAAVGQRIKTLEDYLGVDLIVRGRSGLRPTEALSQALPHLSRAFMELASASEALDFQRINEIHIASNSDWAELWLAPRLASFKSAHPNILFCVNGEGDVPLRIGPADIVVSFGERVESEAHSELFRDFLIPISSPENTQRIAKIDTRNRLEGFPLLHLDFYKDDPDAPDWADWVALHGHRKSKPVHGIRFQRIAPGLEAVNSSAGLMICGLAMIADRIGSGEITLPFPDTGVWTRHVFQARFRQDVIVRPQVRRFREWLEAEAETTRGELKRLAATSQPKKGRKGQR